MHAYVLILTPAGDVDTVSELLWQRPGISGIEELPADGHPLFRVVPDYRWVEPGTEAAGAFIEYLAAEEFRGDDRVLLRVCVAVDDRTAWDEWLTAFQQDEPSLTVVSHGILPAEDYTASYRQRIRGQAVGRTLWVGPPWDTPEPNRRPIVINPGMAFGTGEHATTRLCLELLEDLAEMKPSPRRIFDIGTGSGVLAIAAVKLWPDAETWLSDYDPLCEANAEQNFRLNGLAGLPEHAWWGEEAELSRIAPPPGGFDLVLSNLYLTALVDIAGSVREMVGDSGCWIASGLWGEEQWETFRTAATAAGWEVQVMRSMADDDSTWYGVRLERG